MLDELIVEQRLIDLFLVSSMRPSLSKSENALTSAVSVINGRFKRHHSIDDDYPLAAPSSSSSSDDGKNVHVHFHPDVVLSDHRVPFANPSANIQPVSSQQSSFSSELLVGAHADLSL